MYWLASLKEALPPYPTVEGRLDGKETAADGTHYLQIGLTKVEVDSVTHEALNVGDWLRVRYTRSKRAINIDRLKPPSGGFQ